MREGVDVLAASEFARLVEMSGLLNLLEENSKGGVFPVRGGELRKKVHALLSDCNEWFELYERSNVERALQIPRTQMERVNCALEKIEKQLSRVLVPTVSDKVSLDESAPVVVSASVVGVGEHCVRVGGGGEVGGNEGTGQGREAALPCAYNPANKR